MGAVPRKSDGRRVFNTGSSGRRWPSSHPSTDTRPLGENPKGYGHRPYPFDFIGFEGSVELILRNARCFAYRYGQITPQRL